MGQLPDAEAPVRNRLRKRVFAWMMARGSGAYERFIAERKRALLGGLRGTVAEIGPGAGPNLPYYAPEVVWIGVEPNPYMHHYLRAEAERLRRPIEVRTGSAEHLPFEAESLDAVVSTLVLCSVPNLMGSLREVLRVLKPGGRFVFIEHVAAPPGTTLARVQHAVRPLWRVVGDGCEPDRDIGRWVRAAGFGEVEIEQFDAPAPIVAPHIAGHAIKGS